MSSFFTETSSNSSITEPEDSGKTDLRWSIKAATPEEKQTLKDLGFSDQELENDPIPTVTEEGRAGALQDWALKKAARIRLTMGNSHTIVKLLQSNKELIIFLP